MFNPRRRLSFPRAHSMELGQISQVFAGIPFRSFATLGDRWTGGPGHFGGTGAWRLVGRWGVNGRPTRSRPVLEPSAGLAGRLSRLGRSSPTGPRAERGEVNARCRGAARDALATIARLHVASSFQHSPIPARIGVGESRTRVGQSEAPRTVGWIVDIEPVVGGVHRCRPLPPRRRTEPFLPTRRLLA